MKPVYYGADNVIFVPMLNTNSTHIPKIQLPLAIGDYNSFTINPVVLQPKSANNMPTINQANGSLTIRLTVDEPVIVEISYKFQTDPTVHKI